MPTTSSPAEVRAALLEDRAATELRISALSGDIKAVTDAVSDVATDDEHDPEGATIAFEHARVGALPEQARDHLSAIAHAEPRLRDGVLDECEICGRLIGAARRDARPTGTTCISCAARRRRVRV